MTQNEIKSKQVDSFSSFTEDNEDDLTKPMEQNQSDSPQTKQTQQQAGQNKLQQVK